MLYIWPYVMFFSLPLIYPYVVNVLPHGMFPQFLRFNYRQIRARPRLSVALIFAGLMLCIVHFNTIVHPFILADNRHYVFYVFRWIILRHPFAKYFVVPIYLVSGWATITALGGIHAPDGSTASGENTSGRDEPANRWSNRVSFVVVWLIATTLSLVTAPLVEPRYFILPWVMWRLYLPSTVFTVERALDANRPRSRPHPYLGKLFSCGFSSPLWLETAWLLLVNSLTMYVFLYRGFKWPQEPGNVQRFMW
jgi:alpha-1,2-glucosyltransferase